MEFWGVEVKPGQSLKVQPELYKLIHISQASLGEYKEGNGPKNVTLKLKIDGKDFVIGSLAGEERSQLMFDLVFEKEFELSHGWKSGSVYFLGYIADDAGSDDEGDFDLPEGLSEDELVAAPKNGDAKPKAETVSAAKKDEPVSDEDEDDSDSDDEDDDDIDSDDLMGSSDEEEEVPQAQPAKKNAKRPAESPKEAAAAKKSKSEQKASPVAAKNSGGKPQQGSNKKPQGGNNKSPQGGNKFNGQKQGGNKFNGQKGKAGGQRK